MGQINNLAGNTPLINFRSANVFILLLSLTMVLCNPPYHNGRELGSGRRHHRDQIRCHEDQYTGVKNPKSPNADVIGTGGPKVIELSPEMNPIKMNPEVQGGDTIKIFPVDAEPKPRMETLPSKTNTSCSEGYGIHKPTGKCYKFSRHSEPAQDSPCGPFMEFYKEPSDPLYGDCDCKQEVGGIARPILYYGLTDKCYWQFDQGPCKADEWLIMDENNIPSCFKRSCPDNLPEDWSIDPAEINKKKFWFRYRGKCYQTGTQAYCENPRQKAFYESSKETGYILRCKDFGIMVKTLLNGVKELPCSPGHKKSISGDCSRVVSFQ